MLNPRVGVESSQNVLAKVMQKSLRALAIRFILVGLCSAIIALAVGMSFVLRPVGAICLTLWIALLLVVKEMSLLFSMIFAQHKKLTELEKRIGERESDAQ